MQRFLDIFFSLIALIVLSPIIFLVMGVLRVTGEGEVFYIQQRVGMKGELFGLVKFATMLKNSPNMGAGQINIRNDPRVLFFGKFLRKTKLNELPQLVNIFIGDMSVVGPRPMVPDTYAYYPKTGREKLNSVRPGLTGIGSIFFRDEESYLTNPQYAMKFYREHIIPYKCDLEVWFVENNSLYLYLKLILVTAWIVIIPKSRITSYALKGAPSKPKVFL